MNYNSHYVIDTNIILQDASNLFKLSDDATNLIIISETVLDEINFQVKDSIIYFK